MTSGFSRKFLRLRGWEVVNPAGHNVRFWAYPCGCHEPVRLVLRPGDRLVFSSWGLHDEGWERNDDEFCYDGEQVVLRQYSDGTDCDGRSSHSSEMVMVSASGTWNPHAGVDYGIWRQLDYSHRDYEAEKAGY